MTDSGTVGDETEWPEPVMTLPRKLDLAIWDANPILADQILCILQTDEWLSSRFRIRVTADAVELLSSAPDILIFDPTQDRSFQCRRSSFIDSLAGRTAMIGYCSHAESTEARALMSNGFKAVIPKTVDGVELVRVVSAVSFSGVYLHESYGEKTKELRHIPKSDRPVLLTAREREVLRQVALGSSLKEIAASLKLSTKTVDTYKTRANRKLDLRSRSDIVRFAIQSGWMHETPLTLAVGSPV